MLKARTIPRRGVNMYAYVVPLTTYMRPYCSADNCCTEERFSGAPKRLFARWRTARFATQWPAQ